MKGQRQKKGGMPVIIPRKQMQKIVAELVISEEDQYAGAKNSIKIV